MASYSDNFDDAGLDGWTVVDGLWSQASGEVVRTSTASGGFPVLMQYNTTLATKDQFAQIHFTYAQNNYAFMGVAINQLLGQKTGYSGYARAQGSASVIAQHIDGVNTTLVSGLSGNGPPVTVKLERDGNMLRMYKNGLQIHSYELTGTTLDYTGVGLIAHPTSNNSSRGDNFLAEDLYSAPVAPVLSTPSASSITASSIVPNVTLTF